MPPARKSSIVNHQSSINGLAARLSQIVRDTTAIVCIGNELRGDDAVGVAVAQRLQGAVPWPLYDARNAPESFVMKIVSSRPASVVVVDAVHFGGRPGAVRVLDPGDLGGQGPSTHGPAPLAFLEVLAAMHPCPVAVLGIQPQATETGANLTAPVAQAVDLVVAAFGRLARRSATPEADRRSQADE